MLNFTSAEVQREALHLLQTLPCAAQGTGPSATLCHGSNPFPAGQDCDAPFLASAGSTALHTQPGRINLIQDYHIYFGI